MKLEIGTFQAILLGFGFASMFVLSLYFWLLFEGKRPKGYVYDENSRQELIKRITSVSHKMNYMMIGECLFCDICWFNQYDG